MSPFTLTIGAMLAAAAPADLNLKIVVEGYGEVQTPPTVARFSYEIRGEGQSSDEALKELVARASKVEASLLVVDPALQPKSGNLSVVGVRGTDCKAERYEDAPRLSTGSCAIVGYLAKQSFTALTAKVGDVGTMVGLAGRNGATEPEMTGFDLADSKSAKNQAIAGALADARAKAEAIARGSGVALGSMTTASLDGAREDGDEAIVVTGSRMVRPDLNAPSPVTVTLAPKAIETSARVTVTYAIQR